MVLLQMRPFFLVLVVFVSGSFMLNCSDLPSGMYSVSQLADCNEETILGGGEPYKGGHGDMMGRSKRYTEEDRKKRARVNLNSASQEEVDNLFKNKETLHNVVIYCSNCKFTEIRMENLKSVENAHIEIYTSSLESITISALNASFYAIIIHQNHNLTTLEFGKLFYAYDLNLMDNLVLENVTLKYVDNITAADALELVRIKGNRHLSPSFIESFDEYKKRRGHYIDLQRPNECFGKNIQMGHISLVECERIHGGFEFQGKNNNLGALNLNNFKLKRLQGSFILNNTDIKSVDFLIGATIGGGNSYVINNDVLCDYIDAVDNLMGRLIAENNCKECQVKSPQTNFNILSNCEKVVVGNLTFARSVLPPSKSLKLKRIDGCFTVENTNLESLSFLKGAKANTGCSNSIINNEFLCDYIDVVEKYRGESSSLQVRDNCHACNTFNKPLSDFSKLANCPKMVYGDLSFDKKVVETTRKSFEISRLDGCVYIENSNIRSISFLRKVRTSKNCQNRIFNNPLLCDFLEVLEGHPKLLSTTTFGDNCHACNTFGRSQTNFQLLTRCERLIFGDVIFHESVAPLPRWIYIERIYGCFAIIGTSLTTVKFLAGTRTKSDCINVIKNNKNVCDVAEVLDNLPPGVRVVAENNCEKICYNSDELDTKNCEVLKTVTEVPISYVRESKYLKKVIGPVKITSLKTDTFDPSTLPKVQFEQLVFRGNEFLCDEEAVRKLVPSGTQLKFKQNCWKRCGFPQIQYGRKCTVFVGLFEPRIFGDMELFHRILQKLEGVEGQIKIVGSTAQTLNFRKLKYVKNDNFRGPAILIENNLILKSVVLANLETVTSNSEPRIRIKNNGDFKFQEIDWKRIRNQTKTRIHKSLVIDIEKSTVQAPQCSKADDTSIKMVTPKRGILYFSALSLLFFLLLVIVIIFSLFCWLCYKVESGNY